MAAVQQQVLNWLYSVLTSEYADVNRTYNDIAQTLSHYSSLAPRTDVYTYENGASALLLHLSGTLPVTFRGTIYRFPISLWVPHQYPRESPLIYVTPADGMVVRPGQHVDHQGKVYHPYLVGWAEFWDKSNILDFLAILREVFAKEPPVISQQQYYAPPLPQPAAIPPPIPPLPPGMGRPTSMVSSSNDQTRPPPPPPKPTISSPRASLSSSRRDSGPPLPPLPPQSTQRMSQYGSPPPQPPNSQYQSPQRTGSSRYESAPPLPPQPQRQQLLREESYSPSPVSPMTPPDDPYRRPPYAQSYQQPQVLNSQFQSGQPQNRSPSYMQQPQNSAPPSLWHQYPPQPQQQPQKKPPPPPDLMNAPLDDLPQSNSHLPAPPIPINPEVNILLQNLGQALYSQRQQSVAQTTSNLPGIHSQNRAMLSSLNSMQSEIQALESLTTLLNTNADILHTALRDADAVIDSGQHRKVPSIDEILVAPTVVGNQLYELVSEERSLGDALFVLGRAMERGCITPSVFAKMTRSLAREWYLKKALTKKIGKGMGLNVY